MVFGNNFSKINTWVQNSLSHVKKKLGDSHFWSSLMKVKQHFLQWTQFKVLNGKQVRFWKDTWLGNTALKDQYPNLYHLAHRKHDMVHKVLGGFGKHFFEKESDK